MILDIFWCRPGWRTKSPVRAQDLLAPAEEQVPAADCQSRQQPGVVLSRRHWSAQRQQQKILLEELCSLLAQHIRRSDSSLRTRSHAATTESLRPSSWCRLRRTTELCSGCCMYESPVSPSCKRGEICCCRLLHETVPET